jgi:hypothetical protein
MATVQIGFNSEYYGIDTYDVFVSQCNPISWQQVSNDIPFSSFPVDVNLDAYGITGTCYNYYVSGNTGCYYSAVTSTTQTCPEPSVTPSVTPSQAVTPSVTPSITTTPSVTPTVSVTPTSSITPTMTPTPTPTQSVACKEYSLSCPGSPNVTNTVFSYTRCDGTVVPNLSVSPGTSNTVCAVVGSVSIVSGPGSITELNECFG